MGQPGPQEQRVVPGPEALPGRAHEHLEQEQEVRLCDEEEALAAQKLQVVVGVELLRAQAVADQEGYSAWVLVPLEQEVPGSRAFAAAVMTEFGVVMQGPGAVQQVLVSWAAEEPAVLDLVKEALAPVSSVVEESVVL